MFLYVAVYCAIKYLHYKLIKVDRSQKVQHIAYELWSHGIKQYSWMSIRPWSTISLVQQTVTHAQLYFCIMHVAYIYNTLWLTFNLFLNNHFLIRWMNTFEQWIDDITCSLIRACVQNVTASIIWPVGLLIKLIWVKYVSKILNTCN